MSKITDCITEACELVAKPGRVGVGIKHNDDSQKLDTTLQELKSQILNAILFPNDWTCKYSVGQGRGAEVVWIVFLPPGQKVSDGIYVALCFGKAGNGLVMGCAVSKENKAKYAHVPTCNRTNLEIDVVKYNDVFVNPMDVTSDNLNEELIKKHLKESIDKCKECLNIAKTNTSVVRSQKAEARYKLWKKFVEKWPATAISTLTLDSYTSYGGERNSFCNWLESRTQDLGSVWGGSAYKFGVFKRDPSKDQINDESHGSDASHGWYKRYGNSAATVFAYVKDAFAKIIEAVQKNDLASIDSIDFGHAIKWKIAFLYQSVNNPIVLPIYNKRMLVSLTGMTPKTPTSVMQKKLMDEKPADKDLFDYYDELLKKLPSNIKDGADDDDDKSVALSEKPFDLAALDELRKAVERSGLQYDDALVNRFVAALSAKPFVILTGLSGSGKTKLAQAFAKWMLMPVLDNVKLVPVGADWTNSEHLLGYPNALEPGKYVMPETGVLKLMLDANNNDSLPFFLILDEMNLSHVERYFADFLSAMESGDEIKLYDGEDRYADGVKIPHAFKFPRNLFVIGTMNVDETTYMFSPKVLDRAQVIEFRISKDQMEAYLSNPTELDLDGLAGEGACYAKSFFEKRKAAPSLNESDSEELRKEMTAFFEPLAELGAEFGYRTACEASRFVRYYCETGVGINDAIDAAIIQKFLPKLHGSQARLGPVLEKLSALCDGKYPLSLDKIGRMQKRLEVGFTSFAEA